MREGPQSVRLGLKGIPAQSESICVGRDVEVAGLTGARLHIAHMSARGSLEYVRAAKKQGLRVTCEVTPHHFTLTDEDVRYDSHYKMNPPLASREDRDALIEGLADGSIDAIATDHAPHHPASKDVEFDRAPFGITGFETALALGLSELVHHRADFSDATRGTVHRRARRACWASSARSPRASPPISRSSLPNIPGRSARRIPPANHATRLLMDAPSGARPWRRSSRDASFTSNRLGVGTIPGVASYGGRNGGFALEQFFYNAQKVLAGIAFRKVTVSAGSLNFLHRLIGIVNGKDENLRLRGTA